MRKVDPNSNFADIEDSSHSQIRDSIIKRYGDYWIFLVFWIAALIIKFHSQEQINQSECGEKLVYFLDLYFYGYIAYFGYLLCTLFACYWTFLDPVIRFIQIATFTCFFFGAFIYANYIMYEMTEDCRKNYPEMRLFCIAYILAWYSYIGTRLVMLIMYAVKRGLTGSSHELEGLSLFIDIE